MDGFFLYIKESYNELIHNVTWPTWPELIASARLVVIASIIFALVVFLLDLASKGLTTTIYNLG